MEFHVGRLIDHVHLVVPELGPVRRFYEAALAALGHTVTHAGDGWFSVDELFVSEGEPVTGRVHLAFQAKDRAAVAAFHAAALAAGGRDNGGPGERHYHPGYYAAFVLDPVGNNIEAVFHGPSVRTAPSVAITPA